MRAILFYIPQIVVCKKVDLPNGVFEKLAKETMRGREEKRREE